MTNRKSTRRALLASVISLVMCATMLIGTTFAWFTDTATTGVNKIQAGKLDIALEVATAWDADGKPTAWENAEGKTLDFKKAANAPKDEKILWEPGCTYQLPDLRIVNNGDLYLKYMLSITGINGDAELNKAIEWTFGDYTVGSDYVTLAPNAISDTMTIKGHMKEDAGNEYQGLSIDGIAITVFATQVESEYDSFNNTYDANAPTLVMIGETKYASLAEALNAVDNNGTILLSGYFDMPNIQNKTVTLKAINGHKAVINMKPTVNGNNSTLTFDGIIINTLAKHDGDKNGITHVKDVTFKNCTINGSMTMYGETAKFEKCTFVNYDDYNVWTYGVDVTFTNCTFTTGGKAVLVYTHAPSTSTITVNNCTFNGNGQIATDKAAIEVGDDPTKASNHTIIINNSKANGFAPNNSNSPLWGNKNNMDSEHLVIRVDNSAQSVVRYINTADDLFAFAKEVNVDKNSYAGKTVVLAADIDLKNKAWTPIGQTGATQFLGTFDGNGHTIKNLNIDSSAQTGGNYSSGLFGWIERHGEDADYLMAVKNLTIDNATVKGNHNVAVIAGYLIGTIDNCHVKNAAVVCKHANDDACGDKAGVIAGIAAEAKALIKDCTAAVSTVTAGRDAGQIVGACIVGKVENCTATNVTVSATGDCTGANINNDLIGRKS